MNNIWIIIIIIIIDTVPHTNTVVDPEGAKGPSLMISRVHRSVDQGGPVIIIDR